MRSGEPKPRRQATSDPLPPCLATPLRSAWRFKSSHPHSVGAQSSFGAQPFLAPVWDARLGWCFQPSQNRGSPMTTTQVGARIGKRRENEALLQHGNASSVTADGCELVAFACECHRVTCSETFWMVERDY